MITDVTIDTLEDDILYEIDKIVARDCEMSKIDIIREITGDNQEYNKADVRDIIDANYITVKRVINKDLFKDLLIPEALTKELRFVTKEFLMQYNASPTSNWYHNTTNLGQTSRTLLIPLGWLNDVEYENLA